MKQQQGFIDKYLPDIKYRYYGKWVIITKDNNSIDLSHNKLTKLPDNIKFNNKGYVDLCGNKLTKLPNNIKFNNEGGVDLSHNKLTKLPDNIKFNNEGYVDLSNNLLKSVPRCIENIEYCYIFENVNWNDSYWINRILQDKLTAEEVFSIDNIEHRRIAYEYMDKKKLLDLKDYKVLNKVVDNYDKEMKIIEFKVPNVTDKLLFLNVYCPSTNREYFIQTDVKNSTKAKAKSFGLEKVKWIEEW